jgi:branched-chain amino acid transport system ATP-binding protein
VSDTSAAPLLDVRELHVSYGAVKALRGVSFDVLPGEIVTLIGSNGAGKSTTMGAIIGLVRAQQGGITYAGKSIANTPAHQIVNSGIALAPEGRRIFLNLTVAENLELGGLVTRDKATRQRLEQEVYTLFPRIKERLRQVAGTLSGGEQQMLAVARAMMQNPKLLMLDEPSLGLAPNLVQEIFGKIKLLNDQGTTILLVEQNAFQALRISNRAHVLEQGRIVISGTGAELLHDPRVKEAYLGG